jgi:hypothetical protein
LILVSFPFSFERSFHRGIMFMCYDLGKRRKPAGAAEV